LSALHRLHHSLRRLTEKAIECFQQATETQSLVAFTLRTFKGLELRRRLEKDTRLRHELGFARVPALSELTRDDKFVTRIEAAVS